MTQQLSIPWVLYLGDSVTTVFPMPWYLQDATELEVYVRILTTHVHAHGPPEPHRRNHHVPGPPSQGKCSFCGGSPRKRN
jgi:hypothetical protein